MQRVQTVRAVLGLVAVARMLLSYGPAADADAVIDDRFGEIRTNLIALAITLPVAMAVLITAARPPHRGIFLRRFGKPAGALLTLTVALAVPRLITGLGYVDEETDWTASPWRVLVLFGLGPSCCGSRPSPCTASCRRWCTFFRTADIHETIPPLLATLLLWELAVIDLTGGSYESVPLGVRLVFTLGAPLSVTAVALWELRRLRSRHAITVRGALRR